jgi:hypothetical protein
MNRSRIVLLLTCICLLFSTLDSQNRRMKILMRDSLKTASIKKDTRELFRPDIPLLLKESKGDSSKSK